MSASDTPALCTVSVNVRRAAGGDRRRPNVFVIDRCTSSWTAVSDVLLVSLPVSGSVVPPEATVALL